jgi:succinate dehydrogenase / fumarate reductase cytochrome b subunit
MKGNSRPVFLNLWQLRYPVTAIVSILHRVSGLCLAITLPWIVFGVHYALISEQHFLCMISCFHHHWVIKGFVLISALAYSYHALAGFRHLIMDCGFGLTRKKGVVSAYALLAGYIFIALFLIRGFLWA